MNTGLLIAIIIVAFLAGAAGGWFVLKRQKRASLPSVRNGGSFANLTGKEQKIVGLITERGRVKNDDVQAALGVSDATATRYLDALERKNVIVQHGDRKAAYYELK